jgi:membrane protein required for colicin V production
MNWVDLIIIAYLIISVISGLVQGLIKTLFSIIGTIVGIILAAHFYTQLGGVLTFISNRDAANILGFIIILVAVMIVASIIAWILKTFIKIILLEWLDKLGGAVLGLLLGVISISAFLAIIVKYNQADVLINSKLAAFFLDKFPIVMGLLPSDLNSVRNFFNK